MLFPFSFRTPRLHTLRSLSLYTALAVLGSVATARADLSWTTLRLSTGGNQNGLAFSPERSEHVMVGVKGTIFTSRDAITWTARESTVSNTLSGAAWGAQQYVVVGQGGTILTSPDAINWSLRLSGTSNDLLAVSWMAASGGTAGQFVAVGADGTVLTSPTGQTWTKRTTGVEGNNITLRSLTWANPGGGATGMMLVVGDKGTILTSLDGINWLQHASGTTSSLTGVAWGGGTAMAVGASNTVLTSTTMVVWTVRSTGSALSSGGSGGSSSNFNTVGWGADTTGGRFIAGGTSSNSVISSTDGGLTWKNLNLSSNVKYVTWTGVRYLILGPTGRTFVSHNGLSPVTPLLKSPSDSATGVPASATLAWGTTSGAESFNVQVATDKTFASLVVDDSSLSDTSRVVALTEGTEYFWRVRARNVAGYGSWSATRKFTTMIAPPPAPGLASPAAKALALPVSTILKWLPSATATLYNIQVALDSNFSGVILSDSMTGLSKEIGPLSNGTSYYWRVRARNAGGYGAWSTARSFTTESAATGVPAVPTLTYPAPFATGVPVSLVPTWTHPAGSAKYHLEVSTEPTFLTFVFNDTLNNALLERSSLNLEANTNYYWRVRAGNAFGFGAWSEPGGFTTVITSPSIPVLVSPAAFATEVVNPTQLTWTAAAGAATYQVQLSTVSDFSTLVLNDSTITATQRMTNGLTAQTPYYWRVRARNSAGTSGWAAARRFTPAALTVVSVGASSRSLPEGLSLVSGALTFRLEAMDHVRVRVLDMNGRNALDLADAVYPPGLHEIAIPAARHGDLRLLVFRSGSIRRTLTLLP